MQAAGAAARQEPAPGQGTHAQLVAPSLVPTSADDDQHAPYLDFAARTLTAMVQSSEGGTANGNAAAPSTNTPGCGTPASDDTRAFVASKAPRIEVHAYIMRLAKYTGCSAAAFALAILYVQAVRGQVNVDAMTVHRCVNATWIRAASMQRHCAAMLPRALQSVYVQVLACSHGHSFVLVSTNVKRSSASCRGHMHHGSCLMAEHNAQELASVLA